MTQQLGATVHELVQRLDDGHQVQFGQHHQRLNEHDQQIQNLQELVAKLQQDIQNASTSATSARNEFPQTQGQRAGGSPDLGWDGAVDPTVLRGFSHALISKEAFLTAIAEWLHGCGLEVGRAYDVDGNPDVLSQTWCIQFHGDTGAASKKCRQALAAMKVGAALWVQIWASTPTGHWTQSHISLDKWTAQGNRNVHEKALRDLGGLR